MLNSESIEFAFAKLKQLMLTQVEIEMESKNTINSWLEIHFQTVHLG